MMALLAVVPLLCYDILRQSVAVTSVDGDDASRLIIKISTFYSKHYHTNVASVFLITSLQL